MSTNAVTQQSVKNSTTTTNNTKTKINPNAAFVATGGQVVVSVKTPYSDNVNRIYWSTDNFKTRHFISTDNQVGNYNIGVFPAGTQIEFGIDNGVGGFFRTGAAAYNSDGIAHAIVNKSKTTSSIGFEDTYGGGDYDFNDVLLSVANKPQTKSPAGGGTTTGGGYPVILNPTNKPVDTGGSVAQNDKLSDWLKQLGLEGDNLNLILALLTKSKHLSTNDLLKKIQDLLGSNKTASVNILDLLMANKSVQTIDSSTSLTSSIDLNFIKAIYNVIS